jgi:hypothetical protein
MLVPLDGCIGVVSGQRASSRWCCLIAVLISPRFLPLSEVAHEPGEVAEPGQTER